MMKTRPADLAAADLAASIDQLAGFPAGAEALARTSARELVSQPAAAPLLSRVEPGLTREQRAMMRGALPNAQIAGEVGPGVAPPLAPRGDTARAHLTTVIRSLSGLDENNRGATVELTLPGAPRQTVVEARSRNEEAELIAVTLGYAADNVPTDASTENQALVEWGIGGASFQATVDWLHGTVLCVHGSYLRVTVLAAPNAGIAAPFRQSFSAAVAYGLSGQHENRARLTVPLADLANAATSADVPVPRFAVGVGRMGVAPGGTGVARLQVGSTAPLDVVATYNVASNTNAAEQGSRMFPIGAGARVVRITNGTGALLTRPRLVFDLAL